MSENKFTPGEWRVGKPFTSRFKEYIPIMAPYGCIAETTPVKQNATEEDYANAKLIAAAPEMLRALQEIRAWYELKQRGLFGDYTPVCFSNALSVIKSATS